MPVRRMRRRFARSSRRGRGRGGRLRIGRAKTSIVKCVFESEQIQGWTIVAGTNNLNNQQSYASILPMYFQTSGPLYNAVTYGFTFPLNYLVNAPGNYKYVSQLYDFIKLSKVAVRFKSLINPTEAVTTGATTGVYNFAAYPQTDPVITWVDYDGWGPMVAVGSSTPLIAPPNGDMTQQVYNKRGARKHNPWGTIKRTFIPRRLDLVATDGTSPSGSPALVQGKRLGWQTVNNSAAWGGQLMMAIPYLGQNAQNPNIGGNTNKDLQPVANYSIFCRWFISFKCPLYG